MAPDLHGWNQLVTLLNTAKTKIHGFGFAITLGGPEMAAALSAKRLYPAITAFRNLDEVFGLTTNLNLGDRGWQYRPKRRSGKDLAILAVACDDPCWIHDSLKRDCTAKTCSCNFHTRPSRTIEATTQNANILAPIAALLTRPKRPTDSGASQDVPGATERHTKNFKRHNTMKLTPAQIEQFNQDGYLFFPGLFTSEETRTLTDAVPELYQRREIYNVREKDSDAVRTNFAAHLYSSPFARLACHPRMISPVEQIFNEKLYMHQFKINGKMAFEGDVWQWHQDYGTWLNDDLMPEPRAMNIAIFLDDVYEFNGPLMFIPGSHKKGVIDASHDLTTTSYPLWTINNELIRQLVNRAGGKNGGIVSPKGPAGSMLLFHSCLVHASSSNLSPFNRVSVYLSLCAVSNHIRRFKRPEYIAHRNFTPINCLPDDCLLKEYPVDLPWENGMPESALKVSLEQLAA